MKWFVRLSGWALQTLVNCLFAVPVWRAISWCFHGFFGILPYLKINVSHVAVDSDWTQIGRFCLRNHVAVDSVVLSQESCGRGLSGAVPGIMWPWTQIFFDLSPESCGRGLSGSVSGIMWPWTQRFCLRNHVAVDSDWTQIGRFCLRNHVAGCWCW